MGKGHWYRTTDLPRGYQHFNWYCPGENPFGVFLNDPKGLRTALDGSEPCDLYVYTQHQIVYQDGVLKHTRSSPNWDGGVVTYSTCKHRMRCYHRPDGWEGVWLAGLCPKECEANCLLFCGRVALEFPGNYELGNHLRNVHPDAWEAKRATGNPRGDVYEQRKPYSAGRNDHRWFVEPRGHTRSVEFYKSSPGSVSDRPDGKVPKWWRDLEYVANGRRPPSFVLSPCYLFSHPLLWTSLNPRRAVIKTNPADFAAGLRWTR